MVKRIALVLILIWAGTSAAHDNHPKPRPGWTRQRVNWHLSGGWTIEAIHRPPHPRPYKASPAARPGRIQSATTEAAPAPSVNFTSVSQATATAVVPDTIDSPPIAGFVPWVVVGLTNKRAGELELDAVPSTYVIGNYLTESPLTNYAIGIFDTGAGTSILSYTDASRVGLYDYRPDLITESTVQIAGVTGIVSIRVSQPLGLFVAGLEALDPNTLLLNDSLMVGQTNVSIGVGDLFESPAVPTAIGSPLSVFFTTVFYNDTPVTVVRDGNEYTGPAIYLYDQFDPAIPDFPNTIPMQLRPVGAVAVQYIPNVFIDPFDPLWGSPMNPSVIMGTLTGQSLFFVDSVDLSHNGRPALDKDGFMFDTGAQVSVISQALAARLGLDPDNPDFEVEIRDVTGEMTIQPGFYVDSLQIVASPQWLTYTNVPLVMLDVASPEGGYLDGIIGMNLMINFNFALHGGGMAGQDPPRVEFEWIAARPTADIAPPAGDGKVDALDLAALADAWLATPTSPNWNPQADLAPQPQPDQIINMLDFAELARQWLQGVQH